MDHEAKIQTGESSHASVGDLLPERLQQLTGHITGKYLEIAAACREELDKYSHKLPEAGKEASMSLFLFESLNTTSNLLKILSGKVDKQPGVEMLQILDELKKDIPASFGIEREPAQPDSGNVITDLFSYKKTTDITSHFLLSESVVATLDEHREKFNIYLRSISELLLSLWETGKSIEREVDRVTEGKGDPEKIFAHFNMDEHLQQTRTREESLKTAEQDFIESVRQSVERKVREIEEKSLPVPEPDRRNRQLYSKRNVLRSQDTILNRYKTLLDRWHNSYFVLAEDWMLELEISHLKFFILKQHFDFTGLIRSRYKEPIQKHIESLRNIVGDLTAVFESENKDVSGFRVDGLNKKRIDIKRQLMLRMIPEIRKITFESDLPSRIDDFEQNTAKQFKSLSEERVIIQDVGYKKPTDQKEFDRISPRSLVSFQMMPQFMSNFPQLKQAFIRHLQEVQNRMEEIPEIIDYSLSSALSYYEEKKNASEAQKIGMEGMKRTSLKIDELENRVATFVSEETARTKTGIETLTNNLAEITDNETAVQIKMRITKARAVEKSKQLRNRAVAFFKDILPRIVQFFNRSFRFLRESSIRISRQFIFEGNRHYIATGVSDYLTETEQAINRLPFIYQRLFKTEPLTSFELYTDRSEEIGTLKKAYSRWKEGKFAPTVIIAEKGWGKTTLVNRFLKMKLTHEEVVHLIPGQDSGMEEFFDELMKRTTLENGNAGNQDVSAKKSIVVLDGLEKLFEARINGFEYLSKLLQHISDTNPYIFWITTCHLHAWEFLDKTLDVSDYFGYHVRLTDLSDEGLTKTIERRHNISGYRLFFLPETQKKALLSFKKQTDFGDQEELRKQYFARMHRIVKGNLSQAFLFWMRSAAEVTDDSVYIEHISSENFDFLGSMTDSKLMILKNIVIHNGMTAQKHASLFRINPEKSRLLLQQLYDDGIIVRSGEVYNLNPIIYRQVIDHMYLLNILH